MDYEGQLNVASSDLGSKVIYCSDAFSAESCRLALSSEGVFIVGKCDENG